MICLQFTQYPLQFDNFFPEYKKSQKTRQNDRFVYNLLSISCNMTIIFPKFKKSKISLKSSQKNLWKRFMDFSNQSYSIRYFEIHWKKSWKWLLTFTRLISRIFRTQTFQFDSKKLVKTIDLFRFTSISRIFQFDSLKNFGKSRESNWFVYIYYANFTDSSTKNFLLW